MNSEDLRVQRTRRLLKEALIELILKDGYESVNIRNVTTKAQVGYKTFFRHYESIDQLTDSIGMELVESFQNSLATLGDPNSPTQNTHLALVFAEEHSDILLALIKSPSAQRITLMFLQFANQIGREDFSSSEVPNELVAYHFATSIVSFLQWWLENEAPFPREDMVSYIDKLLLTPLTQLD